MENSGVVTQPDLLSDEEILFFGYTKATIGQRFLNFLIDNVMIRIALTYITGRGLGYVLVAFTPEFAYGLSTNQGRLYLFSFLVAIIDYLLYYTLFEGLFRGTTVGKFITGTKAVTEDGKEISFKKAFLRSACRLIPFEPFSGFGTLWHDSMTGTIVIKTR